jgi:hypothetical protein
MTGAPVSAAETATLPPTQTIPRAPATPGNNDSVRGGTSVVAVTHLGSTRVWSD